MPFDYSSCILAYYSYPIGYVTHYNWTAWISMNDYKNETNRRKTYYSEETWSVASFIKGENFTCIL